MPTIDKRLRALFALISLAAVLLFCAAWLQQPPEQPPVELKARVLQAQESPVLGEDMGSGSGHRVYVPVHTQVERSGTRVPASLQITLVVRNTDERESIRVASARSFDASGQAIGEYIGGSVEVAPMAVHAISVPAREAEETPVASFLVEWFSEQPVREPMVEALMVSSHSARGLSLRSVGHTLEERTGPESSQPQPSQQATQPAFVPERASASLRQR
jgi:hypothetical protein